MRKAPVFLTFLLLASLRVPAQGPPRPVYDGSITDVGTPAHFRVDGHTVTCTDSKTITSHREDGHLVGTMACPQHTLGEHVKVYGEDRDRQNGLRATSVELVDPGDNTVEGTAWTDLVVRRSVKDTILRADGYLLHISPDTKMTFQDGLKPGLEAYQTNEWIAYRGVAHPDGTVTVLKASLGPNVISETEDKMRAKGEFDPATVTDADRQNGVSKYFTGTDRARIPAFDDPDLQARVNTLGARLIPAYQRALPESDPSKIQFRFQLVQDSEQDLYALPSGIILLAHTPLARLRGDSQIAAVLATGIAMVLQKQELRDQPTKRAMLAATVSGGVAGAFLPGAGLVPLVTNGVVSQRAWDRNMQQDGGETLCLMHDAGFDVREAPLAFWETSRKPVKAPKETSPSAYSRYLYELLGTAWRDESQPLPQVSATMAGQSSAP